MSELPSVFRGEFVRLRAITPADWERFHADSEDTEMQRFSDMIRLPRSPEAARRWTEEKSQVAEGDDRILAIENREGELVGSMSVFQCNRRNGTFHYGLGIFREFCRRAYASDVIRLLLRFYFDELHYQKVNAGVYDFNEISIKLHEKLGFRPEGRIRRAYFTNGSYHDELLYGMTAEEFRGETS